MHLRRWPRIAAPMQILQVLRIVSPEELEAERAMLAALPPGGELAPSDNPRHAEGTLGPGISFVWEQHSEACGITLFLGQGEGDTGRRSPGWSAFRAGDACHAHSCRGR
jgi:uncharacterized membrane-anchored protein